MNKIISMLGLCIRAGKLAYGSDMCEEKVKYKKVRLLIVAEDASENTKERFRRIAEQNHVRIYFYSTIDELSHQVGKNNKAVYNKMKRYWKLILKSRDELDFSKWKKFTCFEHLMTEVDVVDYIIN